MEEPRTRVLLPATINVPVACSIRDLLDGGARLHVRPHTQIPERFDLIVEADGRRFSCQIRHRSDASINVQFLSSVQGGIARVG